MEPGINCWQTLDIDPADGENRIKRADAAKIRAHRPDHDAEGCCQVRAAYEKMLRRVQPDNGIITPVAGGCIAVHNQNTGGHSQSERPSRNSQSAASYPAQTRPFPSGGRSCPQGRWGQKAQTPSLPA